MLRLMDANAILRYLLDDNHKQAQAARAVVEEGAFTVPEVLCECVYVLQGSLYGYSRKQIAEALTLLLEDVDCEHKAALLKALEVYAASKLDFVDCILLARAEVEDADVFTFDKKLNSML